MKLTEGSEDYLAFLPLLESYLNQELIPDLSIDYNDLPELYSFLRDVFVTSKDLTDEGTLSIGLGNLTPICTHLFIHTVADVLDLRVNTNKSDLRVLTNLVTHHEEIRKKGYDTYLINSEVGQLPDLTPNHLGTHKWIRPGTKVIVNPSSVTSLEELLSAKALLQYRDGYVPGEYNYANEYNEIYQLGRIFNVPVYTAVTETEMRVLINLIQINDRK